MANLVTFFLKLPTYIEQSPLFNDKILHEHAHIAANFPQFPKIRANVDLKLEINEWLKFRRFHLK